MKDWHLWTMIPVLMLFTLTFFIAFKQDYSINEWLLGNGIVALGIGCVYIGENIFKRFKKQ